MTSEIDLNAISAHAIKEIVLESSKSLFQSITKPIKKIIAKYTEDFNPYLTYTYKKCVNIKTILNPNEPIHLENIYVGCNFVCGDKKFSDEELICTVRENQRVIITGLGGGGKTFFMKKLWLTFFKEQGGRIPVLVELRRLNDLTKMDMYSFLHRSVVGEESGFTHEIFVECLKSGLFVLIFDGFDEINLNRRQEVERFILEISAKYNDCAVVVSGREDERFSGWQNFYKYSICPFDKTQLTQLVNRIDFDKQIKDKFLKKLTSDFFKMHQSFLSSPLLASMMLLTFRNYADIPEKIHIFYDQAFDTLYARHDATKEAFKRELRTGLPIDTFKKIFTNFCFISYMKEKYEFSETELLEYINKAIILEDMEINRAEYLRDLTESVCLVYKEGISYMFVHRSFQEYFSAVYLRYAPPLLIPEVIKNLSRRPRDTSLSMLFDIDKSIIERDYILPTIGILISKIEEGRDGIFKSFISTIEPNFYILPMNDKEYFLYIESDTDFGIFVSVVYRLYARRIGGKNLRALPSFSMADDDKLQKILVNAVKGDSTEFLMNEHGEKRKYLATRKIKVGREGDFVESLVGTSFSLSIEDQFRVLKSVCVSLQKSNDNMILQLIDVIG